MASATDSKMSARLNPGLTRSPFSCCLPAGHARGSRPASVGPGAARVGVGLPGEPQDSFADDVPQDLGGAPADGEGRAEQEPLGPPARLGAERPSLLQQPGGP